MLQQINAVIFLWMIVALSTTIWILELWFEKTRWAVASTLLLIAIVVANCQWINTDIFGFLGNWGLAAATVIAVFLAVVFPALTVICLYFMYWLFFRVGPKH